MAAIVWQAENHTVSFSQREIYSEDVITRNQDDVRIALALENENSFHEPLMTFVSNKGGPSVNEETLQHSLEIQKDANIPNLFAICGSQHDSITISSMQNNELYPLNLPSNANFVDTLFDSQAQNSSRDHACNCNFSSKFSFQGHKVNPNTVMGLTDMALCRISTNVPSEAIYKGTQQKKKRKIHSKADMTTVKPSSCLLPKTPTHCEPSPSFTLQQQTEHCIGEKYALFQTGIGRLEKPPPSFDPMSQSKHIMRPAREINVARYFDALQGPELDILKENEESLLPVNEVWPFLLRFPIGCFSVCLGLTSQAMLWKTLTTAHSMQFMHIPKHINQIIWCLALMAILMVSITYTMKCLFYFEAVRREFFHPVRINFFFAPWIACMLLTLGIPHVVTPTIQPILWVFFMGPIFALELKIYGQWLSGGKRRLSKVANPSTHLSLLGNFIGALLAAKLGWKEVAIFFWAVGFVHYLVLIVTLYQKLPTAAVLAKELHPVYFLFVATPSSASVAWAQIAGHFDLISRFTYFLSLFLYLSLVVRVNLFRGFRFSVTWWAYTYPMTSFAIATLHFSLEIDHPLTRGLAVMLSVISSFIFLPLCIFTMLHLYRGTMFPNDVAIAITEQNYPKKQKIKLLKSQKTCQGSPGGVSHGKTKIHEEEKNIHGERVACEVAPALSQM